MKGRRPPHSRARFREFRKYRKKALCNMRPVDSATRRRQQDQIDAERQVTSAISLGVIKNLTKAGFIAMVQRSERELTASRGGW